MLMQRSSSRVHGIGTQAQHALLSKPQTDIHYKNFVSSFLEKMLCVTATDGWLPIASRSLPSHEDRVYLDSVGDVEGLGGGFLGLGSGGSRTSPLAGVAFPCVEYQASATVLEISLNLSFILE